MDLYVSPVQPGGHPKKNATGLSSKVPASVRKSFVASPAETQQPLSRRRPKCRQKSFFQPFTEPIITPFTKYFCKKGYTAKIGATPTTMAAICKEVEVLSMADAA